MNAKELLLSINACPEAIRFASGKTIKQAWEECPRGDWMLFFYASIYPNEIRKLTLAKAYCANTVLHLMSDERSKNAIDVAISFGYGFATLDELKAASSAASAVYAASSADAAASAAYAANASYASYDAAYASYVAASSAADAANAAAYAANAAAYAANAASSAANAAANAAAYAAKTQNQLLTADICRQFLDISSLYDVGE